MGYFHGPDQNERFHDAVSIIRASKMGHGEERVDLALRNIPGFTLDWTTVSPVDRYAYLHNEAGMQIRISIKSEDYDKEIDQLLSTLKRRVNKTVKDQMNQMKEDS